MEKSQKILLFNLVGASSALSLVMAAVLLVRGAFNGDFGVAARFLASYPGSEPFVIFVSPIVLILGPLWLWRAWQSFFPAKEDGETRN